MPRDRAVKALSRGTRTRLALLLGLCRGVELLLLDEPTSGLDPAATHQLLQAIVTHVASEGTTVLFSSHQIAEVEQIADRVAIVDKGRTVMSGSLDALREDYRRIQLVFDGQAPPWTSSLTNVLRVKREGRMLGLLSRGPAEQILEQARALNPVSVQTEPVTLKDIFLDVVAAED